MPWIEQDPPSAKYRGSRSRPADGPEGKNRRSGLKGEPAVEPDQAPGLVDRPARASSLPGLAPNHRNPDRPVTMSRRTATLWVGGTVFLLIWAFILGVVVGRGTIFQNQEFQALEKRLALPDPAKVTPEVVVPGQDAAGQSPDSDQAPAMTFYDSLAQAKPQPGRAVSETGVTKVMPPLPKKEEPAPTPAPDQELLDPASLDPDAKTASAPAAGAPPKPEVTSGVKTVEASESQAPPPKREAGENFTVQVSISSAAERATQTVNKLKAQGFDAYYYQVEHEGRRYFRIRVGRYADRDQAQATMNRLAATGYENMFISELTD